MYKYILFDLDGTLTDPAEGITNSVAYALNRYGIKVEDKKQLYSFIGPPLVDSFANFYGFSKEKSREAVDVYREYFAGKGIFENKVYDGVREMLNNLKKAGFKLAVASSKPELYVRRILERFDLEKYFCFVGGATMDETRVAKNQVIEYVLKNMGVTEKKKVLMVGDRKFDVLGARQMGIDALAVLYGYGTNDEFREIKEENLADSPIQVEKFIMESNKND